MSNCGECKESCNTCVKPIFGVCGLEEGNCISVKDITQIGTCCKTYKISNTMTLASSDGSISIVKNLCSYDLKAKASLNIDRLVSVNGLDGSGHLVDKIKACGNGLISVIPREVSPGNWILEICGNPSTSGGNPVSNVDERVAFKSGCTADFLSGQIEGGNCIDIDKTGCKAIFNLKDCCFTKPEGTITVNTPYEINIQHNAPSSLQTYAIDQANTSGIINGGTGISLTTLSLSGGSVDGLQVTKAGRYRVSYVGQSGISNGVSGAFVNIYSGSTSILSVGYEAPKGLSLTPYNPTDALATMNPLDMENRLFSGSIDVSLPANSVLYIGGEVRTNVTTGNGAGKRGCIMVMPKSTLSVEWISDNSGIFKHTNC